MKKIVKLLILIMAMMVCFIATNSTQAQDKYTLTTSSGIEFSLKDVKITLSQLDGCNFQNSQETIDYIYDFYIQNKDIELYDNRYDVLDNELTQDEILLIVAHPTYYDGLKKSKDDALSTTADLYPNNCGDGQLGNAFQHAYWTMILAYYTNDVEFAYEFVVAHENYDGNPEIHKTMDLYNDEISYNSCRLISDISSLTRGNIIARCQDLMTFGSLIYICFDYEYISEEIYYMATGTTRYVYSKGDFYAHSNSNVPYNIPSRKYTVVSKNPGGPTILP